METQETWKQSVKTTVRWHSPQGNVLGALWEREIAMPRGYGKKRFLRVEAEEFVRSLLCDKADAELTAPTTYEQFAYLQLSLDSIVQIKSVTRGSRLDLKGDKLSLFIETRLKDKEKGYGTITGNSN